MSFLLDALRKSENQKHRGQVPTIHSTDGLDFGQRRVRRPGPWLLLILPAVLVIAWFGWQRFDAGESSEPVRQPSPVGQPVIEDSREAPEQAPETDPDSSLPVIPSHPDAGNAIRPGRTPVEAFEDPGSGSSSTAGGTSANPLAPGVLVEPLPAPVPHRTERPADGTGEELNIDDAAASGPQVVEKEPLEEEPVEYLNTGLSDISYWQLPQSIQEEIPLPRITVMVYSERPEDRFILMGGTRLAEGDEARPGLVLEEIRRDGVIFSYRLYRFLVAR